MQAVRRLGAILGVWAHPDDETYLSGGVMAAAVEAGQRVACVTATAGERGTDDPARWPPWRLARLRRRELAEALRTLGVDDHTWLGFPDGGCADVSDEEAAARIIRVIERVRPDTILTFGSDGVTGHPDHITVGRWARRAAASAATDPSVLAAAKPPGWVRRFADLNGRFDMFRPGHPRPTPPWQLAVDLRLLDRLLDRKVAALRAQASQTAQLVEGFGADRWREWVRREAFRRIQPAPRDPRPGHKLPTTPPQGGGKG